MKYLQWGGATTVIGSLLVIVGAYWGKFLEAGSELQEFTAQPAFLGAVGIGLLGALALVFGVMALGAVQLRHGRGWALAGLVGGVTSAVMLTAGLFAQGSFFPTLAADAPAFLERLAAGEVTGPVGPAILINSLLQSVGLIVFGIATIRTDVFSTWAGIALIVGALLIAIPVTGSNLVLFAALIWMGSRLFTGRVLGQDTGTRDAPSRDTASVGKR